ncbi:Clavaminate synthase-like protein [Amniculicola lignicola CBS 123094]|uniref:Clavaminate synthase-like protein n=1 Tax=Amniculicola lignicola CBS 123094 TaxID=1392246 RepID=A0A6A5X519_9PLEO|nr:Clavaminate synthase-like protein [Amniculicola lignicola CBS 123094]
MTATNKTTITSPIPIIDFSKFLAGSKADKLQIAHQIDSAFRDVGFVYLTGHGVDQQTLSQCFAWSKEFFNLPLATKTLAPHPPGGSHHRGYSAPGLEKVSQHAYDAEAIAKLREVPDFKESFESGNTTDESQPNIWLPEDALPGFRAFMESFFPLCEALVHRILDALSLALDVPEPGLSPTHSESLFQLRLLHYPSIGLEELKENKRSRINAHSDFGTLTLLFQDSVGGLEVEDPKQPGRFSPAPPVEDAVLVNIGDLMARWSNDRWRSTVHRVGIPPMVGGIGGKEEEKVLVPDRYSIPFFATANMDTVIEALPGCWDEERPRKYEPVTAWGYVQMRMAALYAS